MAEEQKIECHLCGGTELYNTVLSARNGVIIGRKRQSGDEWMLVRCLVCLTCGNIMPYLQTPDLERLRTWAYEAAPPTDYAPPEQSAPAPSADSLATDSNPAVVQDSGRGFGTIVILCIVIGVLLGLMGVFYGLTHD